MTTKIFRVGIMSYGPAKTDHNGANYFSYSYCVDVTAESIEQALVEARKLVNAETETYMQKYKQMGFNVAFLVGESKN